MQATASSKIESRNRSSHVIMLIVIWVLIKFSVAVLTMVIRRWPAVILAVSRTPSERGRISRLIVSIIIINGINGVGEPSGSIWANMVDGFFIIPVIIVAIHSGIAMAIFIDS